MLKWYKNLYFGGRIEKKHKKYKRKIQMGVGVIDVYVITLARNQQDQLDIFSANQLLQKSFRRSCPLIVGIAKGYDEALEVLLTIVNEVYRATGDVKIREYVLENAKNLSVSESKHM